MKQTILITGITGFLGSSIGECLFERYNVVATKRTGSDFKNCAHFAEQITWVDTDISGWKEKIIAHHPSIIIHVAWIGVSAADRDNWAVQAKNILFLQQLFEVAANLKVSKFIGMGSQAEYGFINKIVTELQPLKPTTAYGAVKIICSKLIADFCVRNSSAYYWLRIFSVFGEREGLNWLLPSIVTKIGKRKDKRMAFSDGDQLYAYLYIKDFASAVLSIVNSQKDDSGIYNLSSTNFLKIKNIVTLIRDRMNPDFILDFGALPTRENQSTVIAGNMTLYERAFGKIDITSFEDGIQNTIAFYLSKIENEGI